MSNPTKHRYSHRRTTSADPKTRIAAPSVPERLAYTPTPALEPMIHTAATTGPPERIGTGSMPLVPLRMSHQAHSQTTTETMTQSTHPIPEKSRAFVMPSAARIFGTTVRTTMTPTAPMMPTSVITDESNRSNIPW